MDNRNAVFGPEINHYPTIMTDAWIVQNRERLFKHRDRLVFLDTTGQ